MTTTFKKHFVTVSKAIHSVHPALGLPMIGLGTWLLTSALPIWATDQVPSTGAPQIVNNFDPPGQTNAPASALLPGSVAPVVASLVPPAPAPAAGAAGIAALLGSVLGGGQSSGGGSGGGSNGSSSTKSGAPPKNFAPAQSPAQKQAMLPPPTHLTRQAPPEMRTTAPPLVIRPQPPVVSAAPGPVLGTRPAPQVIVAAPPPQQAPVVQVSPFLLLQRQFLMGARGVGGGHWNGGGGGRGRR